MMKLKIYLTILLISTLISIAITISNPAILEHLVLIGPNYTQFWIK